jgi:hypothetical protein
MGKSFATYIEAQLERAGSNWHQLCQATKLSPATLQRCRVTGKPPRLAPATTRIADYFGVTWTDILTAWRSDTDIPVDRENTLEEILPEHVIASARSNSAAAGVSVDTYIQAAVLFFEIVKDTTRKETCIQCLKGVRRFKTNSPIETELEPYT